MNDISIHQQVRDEIAALHRFFVGWFSGALANSSEIFDTQFGRRFDEHFQLIPPAGTKLGLSTLTSDIRAAHGSNPDFRIAIRGVQVCHRCDHYVLATYEEWQRNARASSPADNGRRASVLFGAGDELRWQHVHETWLPPDVMEAGPYDF